MIKLIFFIFAPILWPWYIVLVYDAIKDISCDIKKNIRK